MTLPPRHLLLATLLHVVMFAFLFVGVQCSQPIETTPVVQGVLINPNDLKALRPPTPPSPQPVKPDEPDQGPQKIVPNTDVVADKALEAREKAAVEQQKKLEDQKLEEQRQKEAQAKAEELKKQELAKQQEADQAAAAKKQEEAKRKAEAAAAEAERKKELDEQLRKEAQEQQQAQAAALAKQKKAEEAQQAADRRRRAEELKKQLGVESAQLTAQIQNEWALQLTAALTNAWARPPGTDQNLKAYLLMTLSATGAVQSATIDSGSGVPGFDDSVVRAAYRASPMPLPRDPSAFVPNVRICFSPNPRNCQ